MINPNLGFTLLFVENPQKSIPFYQDILHLKPVQVSPTFVVFALPNDVMLGLWSKHTAEPRVESSPGGFELGFATENVDELYEELGEKGVTVAQKPTEMDFGRTFLILDPDGHRIRIYKLQEQQA